MERLLSGIGMLRLVTWVLTLGLLGLSFYLAGNNIYYLLFAKRTEGIVYGLRVEDPLAKTSLTSKKEGSLILFVHPNVKINIDGQEHAVSTPDYFYAFDFFWRFNIPIGNVEVNEKVELLYFPGTPPKVKINKFTLMWLRVLIISFFGYASLLLSRIIHQGSQREEERIRMLRERGTKLWAQITKIDLGESSFSNNLHCTFKNPKTGQIQTFQSEPSALIDTKSCPVGASILVYIDPQDPENYFVDYRVVKKTAA